MTNDFKIEELKMILETIAAIRARLQNEATPNKDDMQCLIALYASIGNRAEAFIEAIIKLQIKKKVA